MTKERLKAYRAVILERQLTEGKIKRTREKIQEIEAELTPDSVAAALGVE